jgi:hypothetical protein
VADDFASIGSRVGVLDYLGRSLAGWHRHMTLASVAHAAVSLFGIPRPGAVDGFPCLSGVSGARFGSDGSWA